MSSPYSQMPPVGGLPAPGGGGGGFMGMLPWLGAGLAGAGAVYGAYNQNQTNSANLAAQQQRYAQLMSMIQGQMQQGPNPYSQQLMGLFGGGQQQQGFTPMPVNTGSFQTGLPFGRGGGGDPSQSNMMVNPQQSQMMIDNPGAPPQDLGSMNPVDRVRAMVQQARGSVPGGFGGGGGGGGGGVIGGTVGSGPQLQQFTPYAAQQYRAAQAQRQQMGAAPQVSTPQALSYLTVNGPGMTQPQNVTAPGMGPTQSAVNPGQVSASQIAPGFNAQQIQTPGQINVPLIGDPQFGSQFNTGQDALMQMLRRGPNQAHDTALQQNLSQMYNPQAYDVNGIIAAQQPLVDKSLETQASALRGSAGSLGQRFGSAMGQNEALLRSSVLNQQNLNNQNLFKSAYDQSQANRLQALGLGQQGLAQQNTFNLGAAAQQQQAAQSLQQGGFQQAQLGQQAQQANAANILQAQGIDVNAYLQAAQANQGAGLQAQGQNLQALLANQSTGLQASQLNAGNNLQAMLQAQQLNQQGYQFGAGQNLQAQLANQGMGFQTGQFNAQQALQAMLANQSAGMQTGQFNNQQQLQAMLANQGVASQFGLQQGNMDLQTALANMGALNQAGQFNSQQGLAGAQLNAQQMDIYNQNLLSSIGQANSMQQGQNQYNLGLMGLLSGQAVPQQQPSATPGAMGDVGQLMMLLNMLQGRH